MNKFLLGLTVLASCFTAQASDLDSEGYPTFYIMGEKYQTWQPTPEMKFSRSGDVYTLTVPSLSGSFKISTSDWDINYGHPSNEEHYNDAFSIVGILNGKNFIADNLNDVTVRFNYSRTDSSSAAIYISANGHEAPEIIIPSTKGDLPVLHINVYKEGSSDFNNEVIDYNLDHKVYFAGEYWLDINGCEWAEEAGYKSIGSEEEPLPLQIKARGNYTRLGFSKKPFKLKLDKKQEFLGMTKSKHYAILAHADDSYGYLRNFIGFNLGKRIGLPWTPSQQPIEVYINNDYRGIYFLTESIRVDEDRVNIVELADEVTDGTLISGGYLIELDNYDEDNQIRMEERYCAGDYHDVLRITFDTPEICSEIQKTFLHDQFSAMNEAVGRCNVSDDLWKYIDIDDLARYYLVEEIISHTEAFHGSTYMFRDYGENQKWHFSPLWDCGCAFMGQTDHFFYQDGPFGNTWIQSIRENSYFNQKVKDTWTWFMQNCYDGIVDDVDKYVDQIRAAAIRDRARWKDAPRPNYEYATDVVDNTDMTGRRNDAMNHLSAKIEWLKGQFGDYSALPSASEPERDRTPAAPLPEYAMTSVPEIPAASINGPATYYNLQGQKVESPVSGQIYIVVTPSMSGKVIF